MTAARGTDWSALIPGAPLGDAWHVPPAWLDALQDDLDERSRRFVSRFVLGGIHSAAAHAERRFLAAAREHDAPPHREQLLHLGGEEDDHAAAFEAFATRACGGLLPDRVVALGSVPAGDAARAALLFGRLLVAEEILDAIDLALARDEHVHAAVRALHAAHHADESRHLAFGRAAVPALVSDCERLEGCGAAAGVRRELACTARATWRAALGAEPYARAGLPSPVAARDAAWSAPALADFRARVSRQRLQSLVRRGVVAEEALS